MHNLRGFPGGPVVKNPHCKVGDAGSVTGGRTKDPTCCCALESEHYSY